MTLRLLSCRAEDEGERRGQGAMVMKQERLKESLCVGSQGFVSALIATDQRQTDRPQGQM